MVKVRESADDFTMDEKRAVIKYRCVNDLFFLNQRVLKLEGGLDFGGLHKDMCNFLVEDGNRKMLQVARGHFKSTVVTEGLTCQQIMKNPEVRVLIVNVRLENSKGFLRKIKSHFERNEMFRWLNQEILPPKGNKWTETEIIVKRKSGFQEATVEAIGVGGSLVSKHYDLIIYDDVVNDENTATKEQIGKLLQWWQATLSLLEPDGKVIVIGTRWHFNDLYGYIENNLPDFKVFKRGCTVGGKNIDSPEARPIFEEKFSIDYLKQLRREQGSYVFNSQYMMEPIDDSNATFKKSWIKYYDEEDLRGKELKTYTTIDPAGLAKAGTGDYSAIVTCSVDEFNSIYVRETKYGYWNPKELIDEIFLTNEFYKPIRIGLEVVAFQRYLRFALQDEMRLRGDFLPLQELKTSTRVSKELRIRGLQPRFENGTIYMKRMMDELEEELLRFPLSKRDDVVDALAYQSQLWTVPGGVFRKSENRGRRRNRKSNWSVIEPLTGY